MIHKVVPISTRPINTGDPFHDFAVAVQSEIGSFQYWVPYSIGAAFVVFSDKEKGSVLIFRKVKGDKTGAYWCDRITASGKRRGHWSYLQFETSPINPVTTTTSPKE